MYWTPTRTKHPRSGAYRLGSLGSTPRPSPRVVRLPARKDLRSDLPEKPDCTCEGHFRGGAPARPVFRSPCPRRSARLANPLPGNALARLRVLRLRQERVALPGKTCCAEAFSPQQPYAGVAPARPQPARAEEGTITGRTAVAVIAGTVALYRHLQLAPWSGSGHGCHL